MARLNPLRRLIALIWGDWQTNFLWQRILKYSVACTVAVIIAILPAMAKRSAFLTPMVTVFAHPGQRMGIMIESLWLILVGALLGLCWSLLGLFLASLVPESNQPAAYTIRALFLLVSVLIHGFVRSSSPRLLNFVLFMLIASILTVELPVDSTAILFSSIYVPILIGGAVSLVVNFSIFPELSSSYLGSSTIDTLSETMDTLDRAIYWFITPGGDPEEAREERLRLNRTKSRKSNASTVRSSRKKNGFLRKFLAEFPNPLRGPKGRNAASMALNLTTLANLTERKTKLRSRLRLCKAAQDGVNFEIFFSPLPPVAMKPISTSCMSSLVQNIVTLIGTCENKFVVLSHYDSGSSPTALQPKASSSARGQSKLATNEPSTLHPQKYSPKKRKPKQKDKHSKKVDDVRPIREIEAGSMELLESLVMKIRQPVQDFEGSLKEAVHLLMSCLAYCFDVPKLPSGGDTPSCMPLEEIDIGVDSLVDALAHFDTGSAEQLRHAAMNEAGQSVDFMPRMETFLISSFLLAFRQSAAQVLQMLRHARNLVEKRQQRHNRSRIWLPHHNIIRKWLSTGGEFDIMAFPKTPSEKARQGASVASVANATSKSSHTSEEHTSANKGVFADVENRSGEPREKDVLKAPKPKPNVKSRRRRLKAKRDMSSWVSRVRCKAADALEWAQNSDDVDYALKLAVAVFLVTWPAFITSWNGWYSEVRGIWAPMQLVLVFEVAIGTSLFVFVLRLFGVVFGCIVGYLSYEIGRGNRVVSVVVLLFGVVPSIYVQVGTKYVKAGMISIVSMAVVALGAVNRSAPAYEIFYKRLVAFLVGGLVAMLVEILITPVRARDRLVESLSTSVRQVQNMQPAVSVGVDGPERPNFQSQSLYAGFIRARDKAQGALTAAETFLPFCSTEPRLKGSFKPLEPIYGEIIYVLHQIIDRMDNVVQLRMLYGSSILEDLNPKVYAYRRNVAASSTLMLCSVNEALTTWLPLPQFLPSARLAQLRLINRVREILLSQDSKHSQDVLPQSLSRAQEIDEGTARLITERKFLSWNASTAGQMEIIEYLEELVELVKLLVGVNAFRSGMLERPNYREYMRQMETGEMALNQYGESGARDASDETDEMKTPGDSDSGGSALQRRATTILQGVERWRDTRREDDPEYGGDVDSEGEEEADIPASLQRVGTRLWRDNAVVRRRAFTVGDTRARQFP